MSKYRLLYTVVPLSMENLYSIGNVVVEIVELLPSCQLKPPCPGIFDDQDKINKGEFHSWPLTAIALPHKGIYRP